MAKLFDADGNEIEAFTADEVEAKKKEALEAYAKEHPEQGAELKTAQEKITVLEEQLKTAGLSDEQKNRLKADKEAAEKAVKDLTEKFTGEMNALKEQIFGGHKKKLINGLAKDDDTRKKLEDKVASLMKTGDYSQDEDGITKAVADAATIVNGARPSPGLLDGITGAGGRGDGGSHQAPPVETEAGKAQRKLLGITDEDVKQFDPVAGSEVKKS